MKVSIKSMRAAGLAAEQIVAALEHEENECIAKERENARQRQRRYRERLASKNKERVTDVTRDQRDERDMFSPPSSPPSMVSPITPSLTTPSISSSFNIGQIRTSFLRFWKLYPLKKAKKSAERALAKALRETTIEAIEQALTRQIPEWTDPKFIPHPATWLNAGRWSDDVGHVNGAPRREYTPEELEAGREWYRRKQAEAAE